ncbi:hypothetical protein [Desulfobacca acetoxidans]
MRLGCFYLDTPKVTLQLFEANTRFAPVDGTVGAVTLDGEHSPPFLDLFFQIAEVLPQKNYLTRFCYKDKNIYGQNQGYAFSQRI